MLVWATLLSQWRDHLKWLQKLSRNSPNVAVEHRFNRNCVLGPFSLITRRQTSGRSMSVCLLLLETSNSLMQPQSFQFPFQFHSDNSELKVSQRFASFLQISYSKWRINIRFDEPFVCAKDLRRGVFPNLLRATTANSRLLRQSIMNKSHPFGVVGDFLKVYCAGSRCSPAQNQPPGHL